MTTIRPASTLSALSCLEAGAQRWTIKALTFTDTGTGRLADRIVIDVNYEVPEYLTSATESIIEIRPRNDPDPYTVSHTFHNPQLSRPKADEEPSSVYGQMRFACCSQTAGFEVGQSYEIGLGKDMSRIWWWKRGKKSLVFAGGQRRSNVVDWGLPKVGMVLTNAASFAVVQ
ncbi:hypothetical protein LTR08_007224 [Meristemomyces frigidus]|nr:hypothetical protein LTR08_007224 [Meristemomyces frigidus]